MKKKLLVALISAAMVVTSIMPVSATVTANQGENDVNTSVTAENTAESTDNTAEKAEITAKEVKNATIKASAKGIAYNKVKISWEASEKLDGFAVYRATSKSGKYTLKKTTTGTEYTNTGVSYNKTYYYKVRGYKVIDGKKVYTKYSSPASAKAKVATPAKITAVSAAVDKIKVSWSKVSGASGYKLYASSSKSGKYSLIKAGNITSYTKKSPCEKTKYFKVLAYKDVKGKTYYGSFGNVVSAAAGTNSWTASTLEQDLKNWLSEEGYSVRFVKMSELFNNDDWYNSNSAVASGKYYKEYESELQEIKKDIKAEIESLEKYYSEAGNELVNYSFSFDMEVKDAVNAYGKSLDGVEIYITDNSAAEYNYPDLDEATKAEYIARVLELVNQERAKAGLSQLVLDKQLCALADFKVNEMDELGYFAHTSPVSGSLTQQAAAFGIANGCGENIAKGWGMTPDKAMEGWMNSEGHRANILNPKYTRIGIACHVEKNHGKLILWAQEFKS